MSQHVWWYTARAAGIVAYALVTITIVWGVALTSNLTRTPRPAWVLDVHRFLGVLAVLFTGVHLAGLAADSYVQFGPTDLLVPFASHWKPTAVAWGIVALYLLAAVELTSLAMRFLPRRVWHAIHLSSYALFVLVTIHLLTAGTDAARPIVQGATVAAVAAITLLTAVRVLARRGEPAPRGPSRDDTTSPRPARTGATPDRQAMLARARASRQPPPDAAVPSEADAVPVE